MKYDLSNIMTNAWRTRRMTGCTMSEALHQSWAEAKKPSYSVNGWFMSRSFTDSERLAIIGVSPVSLRETEKAVQLSWDTSYGKIVRWAPKSCLETAEGLESENTAEKCAQRLEVIKVRQNSYESLVSECRAHGIPARKGWRVATMKQKLAEVVA